MTSRRRSISFETGSVLLQHGADAARVEATLQGMAKGLEAALTIVALSCGIALPGLVWMSFRRSTGA